MDLKEHFGVESDPRRTEGSALYVNTKFGEDSTATSGSDS